MATIIEFEVPTDEFALQETLTSLPDVAIEIERVVADDPERITPYVWARADDFDALETAFEDDPTVENLTTLSTTDEERSYQMTWIGPIDLIVQLLTRHEGTVTHATGSADGWSLRVVFPDHNALSQAYDYLREAGFTIDVQAIYGADDERHIQYGLTETQRTTMVAAFEAGYFEVPRAVSLTDFAAHQGLSHQAVSERLRRAMNSLVEATLITSDEDGE